MYQVWLLDCFLLRVLYPIIDAQYFIPKDQFNFSLEITSQLHLIYHMFHLEPTFQGKLMIFPTYLVKREVLEHGFIKDQQHLSSVSYAYKLIEIWSTIISGGVQIVHLQFVTIANRRSDEILVMQDSFHKTKYYWLVTRLSCQVISECWCSTIHSWSTDTRSTLDMLSELRETKIVNS